MTPIPQWAAVAIAPPQQAISVFLEWNRHSIDVTENHTIASLKPLTLAIGFGNGIEDVARGVLVYRDNVSGRNIGLIGIRQSAIRLVGQAAVGLFEVENASHNCLSWPRRRWNTWRLARTIRNDRNPHNFRMALAAVQQLMIFYICPRPVVLVSVSESAHSNLFPMDLIGQLGPDCFTLALRSSSISVPTMTAARRVAISAIDAKFKSGVYKLGEHHKKEFTDWKSLCFPTHLTPHFGIPAISSALRICELAVDHHEQIGSHMFFICRIVSDVRTNDGSQLHHTAGFHQEFRRQRGDPFSPA